MSQSPRACDACGRAPTVVNLTTVGPSGDVAHAHLCAPCAAARGVHLAEPGPEERAARAAQAAAEARRVGERLAALAAGLPAVVARADAAELAAAQADAWALLAQLAGESAAAGLSADEVRAAVPPGVVALLGRR